MLRFLMYFALAFIAQIAFIVGFVAALNLLDIRDVGFATGAIFMVYLWPLLILPTGGGH